VKGIRARKIPVEKLASCGAAVGCGLFEGEQMTSKTGLTLSFLLICRLAQSVSASQIVDAKIETKLAPNPVEYAALAPDGYETAKGPLPLLQISQRRPSASSGGMNLARSGAKPSAASLSDVCPRPGFGKFINLQGTRD